MIRCGNVSGVNFLLSKLLGMCEKPDITVTLVVCYAARSSVHKKHHVNEKLSETDIRSALSYKLFAKLSIKHPRLRLTARTGATSASGTSILSQTEEAIIASETRSLEFPGTQVEDTIRDTMQNAQLFENSLLKSSLTIQQRTNAGNVIYQWLTQGCEPQLLEKIINKISTLDEKNKGLGLKVLECLFCCCLNYSWLGNYEDTLVY